MSRADRLQAAHDALNRIGVCEADEQIAAIPDLLAVVRAAQGFHETFWNPWRSGRSAAMCADEVADAYGSLRAALTAFEEGR